MKLCQKLSCSEPRAGLKFGHVRSATRSLGQIFEKPCEHYNGHSTVDSIFIELFRMFIFIGSRLSSKFGHVAG